MITRRSSEVLPGPVTFSHHISELRTRLIWPVLALMVGAGVGYSLHKTLIALLRQPLNQALYYSSPAGNFNFIMKVSLIIGIALALPVLVYNVVRFIEPVFAAKVKQLNVYIVTLFSLVLAIMGSLFAFYVVVPMSLHFFLGFNVDGIKPLLAASDYLNFVLNCIITFLIVFQLPLLILFINSITPLPPKKLLKLEKYVIVGSLAIALVLPFSYDPLTQFLIALPIIGLYNLSLLLVWIVNRKTKVAQQPVKQEVESPVFVPLRQSLQQVQPSAMPKILQDYQSQAASPTPTKSVSSLQPQFHSQPRHRTIKYMDFVPQRS